MLEDIRILARPAPALAEAGQVTAGLSAAARSLLARLAQGSAVRSPARPVRSVRAVWQTGHHAEPRRACGAPADEDGGQALARRAHAHAVFRTVQGTERAALDAALAVVEAEVARLRQTLLTYGEALKSIQVYGTDEEARSTAATALRRAPERLGAAPPVPQLDPVADARATHG
jgi:hypothetical protein